MAGPAVSDRKRPYFSAMGTNRLEAFSDGVLAIIITIMVLELEVPHGTDWKDLAPLAPVFLSYILSFIYVGIYWNNHHHFMHVVDRVDGRILWANLHLLFWLSLIPFTTAWMGENHVGALPTAAYGFVLFMAAMAYLVLSLSVIRIQGKDSAIAKAVGKDVKGKISALDVCCRHHPGLLGSRPFVGALCPGGPDVGDPRPPVRTRFHGRALTGKVFDYRPLKWTGRTPRVPPGRQAPRR